MKEKFYRLYLRLTNKYLYDLLKEMDEVKRSLDKAKRNHEKYKHIQDRLFCMRAVFELLRSKK